MVMNDGYSVMHLGGTENGAHKYQIELPYSYRTAASLKEMKLLQNGSSDIHFVFDLLDRHGAHEITEQLLGQDIGNDTRLYNGIGSRIIDVQNGDGRLKVQLEVGLPLPPPKFYSPIVSP